MQFRNTVRDVRWTLYSGAAQGLCRSHGCPRVGPQGRHAEGTVTTFGEGGLSRGLERGSGAGGGTVCACSPPRAHSNSRKGAELRAPPSCLRPRRDDWPPARLLSPGRGPAVGPLQPQWTGMHACGFVLGAWVQLVSLAREASCGRWDTLLGPSSGSWALSPLGAFRLRLEEALVQRPLQLPDREGREGTGKQWTQGTSPLGSESPRLPLGGGGSCTSWLCCPRGFYL